MIIMSRWLMLGFVLSSVASVCHAGTEERGPSFDCGKASSPVEHLICSSAELSSLDGQLGRAMSGWLSTAGAERASRLAAQRGWLKQRLARCNIPAAASLSVAAAQDATVCLKRMYQERLAVLATKPAVGTNPDGPEDEHDACSGLAQAIRTADPGTPSILEGLTKAGTGSVRMDLSDNKIGSGQEARNALRKLLHLSAGMDVPDFSDPDLSNLFVRIHHLGGGSPVIAAETVAGTLHCQTLWFYELPGSGPAKVISPPEEDDGTGYCWGDSHGTYATLGAVGAVPTFAVEQIDNGDETIRLFARRGSEWHPYCRLAVSREQAFEVSHEFCEGEGCSDLRTIAPDLVESYDTTGDVDKYWAGIPSLPVPEAHKARFAAYLRRQAEASPDRSQGTLDAILAQAARATYRSIEIGGQPRTFVSVSQGDLLSDWTGIWADADGKTLQAVDLSPDDIDAPTGVMAEVPTLGDDARTSYVSFGHDSTIVPMRLGGRLLFARVGKSHFGWRDSDDYLIGVFTLEDGRLKPVAGAIVTKARSSATTVTEQ